MNAKDNMLRFAPPTIAPLPDGMHRPIWSVMIPTFNCAKYLRQTLESVLVQDPGLEQMQIEVVDDCSTSDDPEAVVREVGNGRVLFYRKAKNAGAIHNFNTCVERSRGQLVHILHGDDFVLPGFYRQVEQCRIAYPKVTGFFLRCFVVSESGDLEFLSDNIPQLLTPSTLPGSLLYQNAIRTPGAVLYRSFYETHGGFLPSLVHVADWEMWLRCITLCGAIFVNKPLASYRAFAGNDTGRLAKTGEIVRDNMRLCEVLSNRVAGFDSQRFIETVANTALYLRNHFYSQRDMEAAQVNDKLWKELAPKATLATRFRLAVGALMAALRQH